MDLSRLLRRRLLPAFVAGLTRAPKAANILTTQLSCQHLRSHHNHKVSKTVSILGCSHRPNASQTRRFKGQHMTSSCPHRCQLALVCVRIKCVDPAGIFHPSSSWQPTDHSLMMSAISMVQLFKGFPADTFGCLITYVCLAKDIGLPKTLSETPETAEWRLLDS